MRSEENAICDQVPHLWAWVVEVLLHTEDSFSRLVLPEFHVLELSQRLFDRSVAVHACSPSTAVISTSMSMDLLPFAKA
jgi:hypothetical protein